jgi:hypothetical protein
MSALLTATNCNTAAFEAKNNSHISVWNYHEYLK